MPIIDSRLTVGIWAEWPAGARWANEGMVRLLGFLIEGAAANRKILFRVVLPDSIRQDADADLATLKATIGLDYSLHSPSDRPAAPGDHAASPDHDAEMRELVQFANDRVAVDGWLVLFPHFEYARFLTGHKAVIFPDAIPRVFPLFRRGNWNEGGASQIWFEKVKKVLAAADRFVTFSHHVADSQLVGLFQCEPDLIDIVPHAPPLLDGIFPLGAEGKTSASKAAAARLLREHAEARGWDYLRDFPFEEVRYIAVSTQDRQTKNIPLAAEAVRILTREHFIDLKILMTAPIHYGHDWTPLPDFIEKNRMEMDIVSMPDLPRDVHAAFYHCATITIHPSFFEGGQAPFPFYESVSVGTPCLFARGPHTEELTAPVPALGAYMFDPYEAGELARSIARILEHSDDAIRDQRSTLGILASHRTWADVALDYARSAVPSFTS